MHSETSLGARMCCFCRANRDRGTCCCGACMEEAAAASMRRRRPVATSRFILCWKRASTSRLRRSTMTSPLPPTVDLIAANCASRTPSRLSSTVSLYEKYPLAAKLRTHRPHTRTVTLGDVVVANRARFSHTLEVILLGNLSMSFGSSLIQSASDSIFVY